MYKEEKTATAMNVARGRRFLRVLKEKKDNNFGTA
jgi:hypothetical protein